MNRANRAAFGIALRQGLATAVWPSAAAAVLALAGAQVVAPATSSAEAARGALAPWLATPLLVLAAANAAALLRTWPWFGTDAPGAELAARWVGGRARGHFGACAAALVLQVLLGSLLLVGLGRWFGAPATAVAEHWPVASGPSTLLPERPRLTANLPNGTLASAVVLRPIALLPRGPFQPSAVQVLGDGEALGEPVYFTQSGEFATVHFPPRPLQQLELQLRSGTVPLVLPPGAVAVREATAHSGLANAAWAAALAALPLAVAVGLAYLAGARTGLAVVRLVAFGVLFVTTVGGIGTFSTAVHDVLAGRWLGTPAAFWAALPSLAVGATAMIGGMLLRTSGRR
ncbi:MAG: hypothetical protein JNK49_10615 [Planctomycetes bacterium]|nr:hypothetical protein [Planctomycetota bacterium]